MSDRGTVRISPDETMLAQAAADLFVTVTTEAVAARGRADVVLTGGSSPQAMHRLLATPDYAAKVPWPLVHIWFTDERAVPPDDPRSNYGAARDALLAHVPIPETNVHRMVGELPIDVAAVRYVEELTRNFALETGALPRFDLLWLGLGPDGHVCSLFPGDPQVDMLDQLVVGVQHSTGPEPYVDRISLTLASVNGAALIVFLINGASKAAIAARALEEQPASIDDRLPSQRVTPTEGQMLWMLDMAAAGDLHL
jgi:6-phosphogluconolactonase